MRCARISHILVITWRHVRSRKGSVMGFLYCASPSFQETRAINLLLRIFSYQTTVGAKAKRSKNNKKRTRKFSFGKPQESCHPQHNQSRGHPSTMRGATQSQMECTLVQGRSKTGGTLSWTYGRTRVPLQRTWDQRHKHHIKNIGPETGVPPGKDM